MNKKPRILFICKRRNDSYGPSYGLINSCKFICNALNKHKIESKVVSVIDNNCIDKELHNYKPTHVFIEALWVVPSKFEELIPLYPHIKWYVRIHSKIPFISNEGVAMQWLREYDKLSKIYPNLYISANNTEIIEALYDTYKIKVQYHPNIYCPDLCNFKEKHFHHKNTMEIGCFGAIHPMKNQLIQALAAMSFGNQMYKNIRFHINGDRIEQKGDVILKNLENAFKGTRHQLIKHNWMEHNDFIKLVKTMDLGMQVSLSETFNIVAADFAWNDIPVVGSDEIEWLNVFFKADTSDVKDIIDKLYMAYYGKKIGLQHLNFWKLNQYNKESLNWWLCQL